MRSQETVFVNFTSKQILPYVFAVVNAHYYAAQWHSLRNASYRPAVSAFTHDYLCTALAELCGWPGPGCRLVGLLYRPPPDRPHPQSLAETGAGFGNQHWRPGGELNTPSAGRGSGYSLQVDNVAALCHI